MAMCQFILSSSEEKLILSPNADSVATFCEVSFSDKTLVVAFPSKNGDCETTI
jgi:hypothetical protein